MASCYNKKVYLFYIDEKELSDIVLSSIFNKSYINIADKRYVLYGYTNDKYAYKHFKEERIKSFLVFKKIMSNDEYDKFTSKYSSTKIQFNTFYGQRGSVEICSTTCEKYFCETIWVDEFDPSTTLSYISKDILLSLKSKYRLNLYKLILYDLIDSTDLETGFMYDAVRPNTMNAFIIYFKSLIRKIK